VLRLRMSEGMPPLPLYRHRMHSDNFSTTIISRSVTRAYLTCYHILLLEDNLWVWCH